MEVSIRQLPRLAGPLTIGGRVTHYQQNKNQPLQRNTFRQFIAYIFGKPKMIEDNFFGNMVDAGTYFECKRWFRPIGRELEIGLKKAGTKNREQQKIFFIWVAENYHKIIAMITPAIEQKVAEWIPNYRIKNFEQAYDLEYLSIPDWSEPTLEWEMSFYEKTDLRHSVSISLTGHSLKDLTIENILIDG